MADECYMLMHKWGKKSLKHKMLEGSPPKVFVAMAASASDMIFGDCFEMLPFILPPKGWIKVDAFSHSISALSSPADNNYERKLQAYHRAAQTGEARRSGITNYIDHSDRADSGIKRLRHAKKHSTIRRGVETHDAATVGGAPALNVNMGNANIVDSDLDAKETDLKSPRQWHRRRQHIGGFDTPLPAVPVVAQDDKKWYQLGGDKLPSHGNFSITKRVDRATPQIAYCCASAMKMRFAWLFLRKKTGPGPPQLRIPHCMIRLEKCIVTDHQLTDSNEIFQLSYKKISWYYVDSFTNTGVPAGWFNYSWDTEENKGNKD